MNSKKNSKLEHVRQGDVMLVRATTKVDLKDAKIAPPKFGRTILAYGEVTGHHHFLPGDVATLYEATPEMKSLAGQLFALTGSDVVVGVVNVEQDTVIEHQEHGQIEVGAGQWWVVRQREYTPAAPRSVAD